MELFAAPSGAWYTSPAMIDFYEVSKSYGRQEVLREASFHVAGGDRIGVVGPNGAGKTTLFQIILGETSPDSGSIHKSKGLTIGHLPQEVGRVGSQKLLPMVMDTVTDLKRISDELASIQGALAVQPGKEELLALTHRQSTLLEQYDHLGGYTLKSRAERILHGLGFRDRDFDRPIEVFSGGWRMRALLARILLAEPELILLDEPTNHLDLESMLWLEEYLLGLNTTVIVISHDRAFLNKTVKRIIELDSGKLGLYAGNYDYYVEEKQNRLAHLVSAKAKQAEKIRQMKGYIDRNRTRAATAKQAQARIKALEKMERIELPGEGGEIRFVFPQGTRPPANLIELSGVDLSYGREIPVFEGLEARVGRDERIALVGPNGAGKSSLLKMLAGLVHPDEGERNVPANVKIAYFAQHQTEQLNPELSVLEELMAVSGQATQTAMRTLLGAFLFSGEDVFKKVSVLSGGEKSRLVLAKLLFSGANLLLLDEPTNHLDIPSRSALEQALKTWPGSICLVTHDRRLINAVANRIWEVQPDPEGEGGATLTVYPGNLNDYLTTWQKLKTGPGEEPSKDNGSGGRRVKTKARKDKEARRKEAELRKQVGRETQKLREEVGRLEKLSADKEAQLEKVNASLADPAIYQDGAKAAQRSKEAAELRARLDRLQEEWTRASLALEAAAENAAAPND